MTRTPFAFWSIFVVGVAAQLALWAAFHQPQHPADGTGTIAGLSYSPYGRNESPSETKVLNSEALSRDLALIATHTDSIRTYGVTDGLEAIPAEAARHGLSVTAGVWVDKNAHHTELELIGAVRLANRNPNIERIVVGNEAVHRGDVSVDTLIAHMDRLREAVSVPVGTAEPWYVWLDHPELAAHSDFVGIHILPYWEGVPAAETIDYIDYRYRQIRDAFPGKPIVLGEIGWPSDGTRIGGAVATPSNQALVVRDFAEYAERTGLTPYFMVEAFDQPWKAGVEGLVGAYWGLFDAERAPKFAWQGSVVDRTTWPAWALLASLFGVVPVALARRLRPLLHARAAALLTISGQAMGTMLVVSLLLAAERYMEEGDWAAWSALFLCEAFLFIVLTVELVEAVGLSLASSPARGHPHCMPAQRTQAPWPKVSIHLPCCNEPPELLNQTLNALAGLDYPDFEVLVIDNNTAERKTSETIAAQCRALGSRFRFLHLPHCTGYKAGALNKALDATHNDASVIAVVDCDYVVEPHWLEAAIPYFSEPEIGLVQAPQDYRDADESAFKTACYWEYKAFFRLGMVFRSQDNAIIQHGTMTLVRRSALIDAGGWDETCITEDAELGLRLFAHGWKSAYLPATLGRGVMPDDQGSYGRQRHRWVFGAMQILRRHCSMLLGRVPSQLTPAQRYHFVAGWLPWIGDGIGLVMAVGGVVWVGLTVAWPTHFQPPQAHFLAPVLVVFVARHMRLWRLYSHHVHSTIFQRAAAMLAGVSLAHSVARAVLTAIFRTTFSFIRTPKLLRAPKLKHRLLAVREETALLAVLAAAALALITSQDLARLDVRLWLGVLAMQAVPYAAAFVLACSFVRPRATKVLSPTMTIVPKTADLQPGSIKTSSVTANPFIAAAFVQGEPDGELDPLSDPGPSLAPRWRSPPKAPPTISPSASSVSGES